jgi:hypothetical protein
VIGRKGERPMKLKYVLAGLFIAGFATPALADYWVIQDPTTKKCSVVNEKPTAGPTVVVLLNKEQALKTEAEATDYITRTTECNRSAG